MRATILIILINLVLISCQTDKKREIVIISEINKKFLKNKNVIKNRFYYKYNFILTSNDRIYYFVNTHVINCTPDCMGFDFSKPEFLRLLPSDLKEIQLDSLKLILYRIVINKTSRFEVISISSDVDTIKNLALKSLIDYAKNYNKDTLRIGYNYRLMTEEEQIVLDAKKKNVNYNPDNVTWKGDFGGFKFNVPNDTD
jgi:hypothetical protein